MDRQAMQSEYDAGTIGKQALGKLRRLKLQDILNSILELSGSDAAGWLDKKKSRIDRSKLAIAVGLRVKPDNLRQSFKSDIEAAEFKLRQLNVIINDPKTNKQIGDENVSRFLCFINERLANDGYEWPVNNKKRLYHKKIWSFFLDQPIEDIKSAPTFFSRNATVKEKLIDIDLMIVKNEVKTICYASETALDEMQETMTSAAISKLRQQVKEVREQLVGEREERKRLESENHALQIELEQYKARDKAMQSSSIAGLKVAGAH
ncbi:hypothetical protein [Pseudoalteromonas denitrificans]|nr:hypothetical protein [Pseudoalteromonas denitrificans]